ncbi:hypothetical protein [Planctomicrobium sp. SH527]|uniref:PPC domain-containing protein n=1 Tax=Planctomicrobium sp. SH527 TaxID=3448123 RepID=UPI003F5C279F
MKRISIQTSAVIVATAVLLVVSPHALRAQLPQTRLTVLAPAGGQVGTTVDVTLVAGELLEDNTQLIFSHPGITAVPKKVTQNGVESLVPKTFQVTIAADVPVGMYDVVCGGRWGISNPKRFSVGERPEINEPENHQTLATAAAINVGSVVHGVIAGAHEVDWYQFPAKKGERIVIECQSTGIDSPLNASLTLLDAAGRRRLAVSRQHNSRDALLVYDVPSDGQYLLKVHDTIYRSGPDYRYRLDLHTGPFIEYVFPPQCLPGAPQRVAVYGHHLPGGRPSGVSVQNVELQVVDVDITVPEDWQSRIASQLVSPFQASADTFPWRMNTPAGTSNAVRIGIATAPVLAETEPNDSTAQAITIPASIGGRFEMPDDRDRFRFQGTKGQKVSIDVVSERLGNAVDPLVVVERVVIKPDMTEQLVAVVTHDDTAPNLSPKFFETQTADPSFLLDLPETATYQITVRSRIGSPKGNDRQQYQLEIREAQPDFIAVALPGLYQQGQITPVSIRQQDRIPVTVYVFRRGGFVGEIRVEQVGNLKELPNEAAIIPANKNFTTFILTANSVKEQQSSLANLQLSAVATLPAVAGQEPVQLRHPVRIATTIHPQKDNVSAICRLTPQMLVGIHPEVAPLQLTASIHELTVAQGSTIQLPVELRRTPAAQEAVQLTIPTPIAATKIVSGTEAIAKEAVKGTLQLQLEDNVAPGLHPIWINGDSQVSYRKKPEVADQAKAALDQFKKEMEPIEAEFKKQEQTKKSARNSVTEATAKLSALQVMVTASQQQAEKTKAMRAALTESQRTLQERLTVATQQVTALNEEITKPPVESSETASSEKSSNKQDLAMKLAAATKLQADLTKENEAAQMQLTSLQKDVSAQEAAILVAQKQLTMAQAELRSSEQQLQLATNAEQASTAILTAKDAVKKRLEEEFTQATKAAEARSLKASAPTQMIFLKVVPATVKMTATTEQAAGIVAGKTMPVAIQIQRLKDFKDAVTIHAIDRSSEVPLKAESIVIPADQTTGTLTLTAPMEIAVGADRVLTLQATTTTAGQETTFEIPFKVTTVAAAQ